jgi:hypothetical protein
LEKAILTARQRVAQSWSPGGRVDVEGLAHPGLAHRFAECRKMVGQQSAVRIQQAHGEEECPTRNAVVAVMCHDVGCPARGKNKLNRG